MHKNNMRNKRIQRQYRHKRVKKNIASLSALPRLAVFRSNKFIYAQIIDDTDSKTIASASDVKIKRENKIERAKEVGHNLATASLKKDIKKVVFDRAGYKYHGRVKSLADGAREGGLVF